MVKIAFVFPGQGSQFSGMGKDFAEKYPVARETFAEADRILGEPLSDTIFFGSEDQLQQTAVTQPAVLTTSVAMARVITELGISPQAAAGLSLGEYSALVVAGAISFKDALPLVRRRAAYMENALPAGRGTMAAVMKLERSQVESICRQARRLGVVEAANFNCPGQTVIAGEVKAVEKAALLAKAAGARVKQLAVSSSFHCSLLREVEGLMEKELKKVNIKPPQVPVIANYSADYVSHPEEIRRALIQQVSHPVYWQDSIERLIADGFDTFIEVGPGKTVSGMIRKIDSSVTTISTGAVSHLGKLLEYANRRKEAWI